MTIRPCHGEDLQRILEIGNEVIRTSPANFHLEEEKFADLESKFESQRELYPWLVSCRGEEVLGYAYGSPFRPREAYRWTVETTIYLDASVRGQGLGRPLYERLLDTLSRQGFHRAIGGITRPNEASEGLHARCGFELCGVVEDAGYKFDRWWDVAFWQKRFDANPDPRPLRSPSVCFFENSS